MGGGAKSEYCRNIKIHPNLSKRDHAIKSDDNKVVDVHCSKHRPLDRNKLHRDCDGHHDGVNQVEAVHESLGEELSLKVPPSVGNAPRIRLQLHQLFFDLLLLLR